MSEQRRCCNRSSCPYYQKNGSRGQCGTTPYVSANDGTSTQFLYFGPNFNRSPSGEIREFQDCQSDTDVPIPIPTLARTLHQAASSLQRTDSGNYSMTLRQIIALSNRLLQHIERHDPRQPRHDAAGAMGQYPAAGFAVPGVMGQYPNTLGAGYVTPAGFGAHGQAIPSAAVTVGGMASPGTANASLGTVPLDLRMLRIEPVHLTIPFTLHFQSTATIPGADQRIQASPSQCLEPIRTAMITPNAQPFSTTDSAMPTQTHTADQLQFPYTTSQQANIYLSEGKFPPIAAQTSSNAQLGAGRVEEPTPSGDVQQPIFLKQPWNFPQTDIKEELISELAPYPSAGASAVMEVDKAVQTEKPQKPLKIKQEPAEFPPPPDPLELETGTTEKYSQTDSHRNHSYLIPTAESKIPPSPNDQLDSKLYQTELEQTLEEGVVTTKSERWTAGRRDISEAMPENTMPQFTTAGEEETALYEEQQRDAQLEKLKEEQEKYEKLPPPLDLSSGPLRIPDNISYPSQYGRSTPSAAAQMVHTGTGTSFSCYSAFNTFPSNGNIPQIGIPMYCHCICRKRNGRGKKDKDRSRSHSRSRSDVNEIRSARKTSSIRFGDDDFYSPDSDSDIETSALRLAPKKAKGNIRESRSKSKSNVQINGMSHETAVLQVLEQMMQILVRMDAVQRGVSLEVEEKPSVKTLYESSRNDGILEEAFTIESKSTVAPSRARCEAVDEEEEKFTKLSIKEEAEEERCDQESVGIQIVTTQEENSMRLGSNGVSNMPILLITFDRETGMPCCCLHSGQTNIAPCKQMPVFEMQPCGAKARLSARTSDHATICTDSQPFAGDEKLTNEQPCTDECFADEETTHFQLLIHDEVQIISETHMKLEPTDINQFAEDTETYTVTVAVQCNEECEAVCAGTQTEECLGPFMEKINADMILQSTDVIEELRDYREELCEYSEEGESVHSYKKLKSRSSKSKSGGYIGVECNCCHCRAERDLRRKSLTQTKPGEVLCVNHDDCKFQLKAIVDSIITDLECMEKVRRRMGGEQVTQQYMDEATAKVPPAHARQSFPVTILEVSELGLASLYVKWVIHDCYGIGGYEIYVDGYLTNRYYNSRHDAAVICDVDVSKPHKVCLMAKPKPEEALIGAGDLLEELSPPLTPANWIPSVFLYEPSANMDYCKKFR